MVTTRGTTRRDWYASTAGGPASSAAAVAVASNAQPGPAVEARCRRLLLLLVLDPGVVMLLLWLRVGVVC